MNLKEILESVHHNPRDVAKIDYVVFRCILANGFIKIFHNKATNNRIICSVKLTEKGRKFLSN